MWGTDFKAELFLKRITFENKYEVENKIEEIKKNLEISQSTLKMYAISNPKDIVPKDWNEQSVDFIRNKIDEIMEIYLDDINTLFLLTEYLETIEDDEIIKK